MAVDAPLRSHAAPPTSAGHALGEDCGILYSQCWEDPLCARAALRIQPGADVLAIGAAGDNVLALLLDEPRQVLAVDVNPAQAALVELKVAAARGLCASDVPPFLGAGAHANRRDVYRRLRPLLSPSASRFWDQESRLISRGVIHGGRFERYLALFRRWVLALAPGGAAVRALLAAPDPDAQERIYRTAWDTPVWRACVRACFGRRLLSARGRHPSMFSTCQIRDVGGHYLRRTAWGLTAIPIRTNPFATYMLTGGYDRAARMPLYLQPDVLPRVACLADRVRVEVGSVRDVLANLPDRSIDAFYLSDVFEPCESEEYEEMLEEIARVGRPGARLCYWNNLVERSRPARLGHVLASHDRLAAALHRQDRAFLYSRFVVESVLGRQQ